MNEETFIALAGIESSLDSLVTHLASIDRSLKMLNLANLGNDDYEDFASRVDRAVVD